MNISSMSANLFTAQTGAGRAVAGAGGQDNDGDHDGSGSRVGGGDGRLLQVMVQALNQSGVTTPDAASADTNAGNGGDTSGHAKEALHQFMHSLFQALKQSDSLGGGTPIGQTDSDGDHDGSRPGETEAAEGSSRGARLAAGVQQLVQSLSSGNPGPAQQALQGSFQNLVDTLGTTGGGSPPTLQSFMQAFADALGGASPSAAGNLHSSHA